MWEAFQQAIFSVIDWFYGFAQDWGLAIILITILFRILIYPITRKQYKSSYQMQKMQPLMNEIKEKYGNDPQRQQEEMSKLYQEAKFNPLSGCLPMLLQMPIAIALFWVLRDLPKYIEGSTHSASLPATFYTIIPDLAGSPGSVFETQGVVAVIPYVILVLLFGVSMLIPMLITRTAIQRQQLIMTGVMAVMMLWFGWTAPAGVLLYWDVSSLLGVAQQMVSRKMLEKKDAEKEAEIEIKPVKVDVERKTKKNRPKKSK